MAKPTRDQLAALIALWEMAQADHGGAKVAGKFLLGLYNGHRFPFDLTDLRVLDAARFHQCLEVLRMDYCPYEEVHVTLGRYCAPDGKPLGFEFEHLAYRLRMKKAMSAGAMKLALRDRAARQNREEASHAVRA
ncbi:MAG: hypothetical protein JNK17_02225 [Hydrogenophaga sp.]|nr:hypothetical protein [Hydrogenophaga sp.]